MSHALSSVRSPIFVASSFQSSNPSRFTGTAYTSDAIILGQEGFNHYCEAQSVEEFCRNVMDGRFYAFVQTPQEYRAFTDPLAQDTLYYYVSQRPSTYHPSNTTGEGEGQAATQWAVSNSLMGLAEYLHGKVKLTAYRPGLLSFLIGGGSGIGAQPVSNRTAFEQIRVLPLGKTLVIDRERGDVRFVGSPQEITRQFEQLSYEELMASALTEGASRLCALNEHGVSLASDLTGGQDSRACFGLLSYALDDWKKVRLISNPRKPQDYRIAQSLIARYGGKLYRNSGRGHGIDAPKAYRYWKLGSLGSYLPAYFPTSENGEAHQYKINGGLILAKQFAAQSPQDFVASLHKVFPSAADHRLVSDEFFSLFDELELERDDPHAMDWFYLAARARYHYGRAWYSSLSFPILSPLINPKLFAASLRLSREELDQGKLSLDILMALDPVLALHPFDSPEKSFSSDLIETSPFWRHGASTITSSLSYRVYSGTAEMPTQEPASRQSDRPDELMRMLNAELESLIKTSSLVSDIMSEAMVKKAISDMASGDKASTRSRRASHALTCAMVESLTH